MDQDKNKRPVLESSEALKGRKAKPKRGMKKFMPAVILVVAIGIGLGLYYGTDIFVPDEVLPESTSSSPEYIKTTLIERPKADLDRITVSIAQGDQYTVKNHIQYDADGNVIPLEATPAPEPEAEATEIPSSPDESSEISEDLEISDETPETEAAPEVLRNYTIEGKPYFKLMEYSATSMANYASLLTSQHTLEENAPDLSMYGLDNPSLTVEFKYRDGTSEKILFGDRTPTGSYYYIMKAGDPGVYMVYSSIYAAYNRTLNSLHEVEMPTVITTDQVQSLLIEQAGKETIELAIVDYNADSLGINTLRLKQPVQYDAHSSRGQEMFDGAVALTVSEYAGHAETPEELAGYGLDVPRMHIHISSADGEQLDFRIGMQDSDKTFVQIDDSGDIYIMDSSLLQFVSNARVGYLADQFTNLVNITKVDTVTVEGGGETYQLGITNETFIDDEGAEKQVSTYYFDGEVTAETPFKKLYQEIIGTLLDNISDDYHHNGEVVAKVTYKLNNGMDDFMVEYLEYNKDYYAVRRDGLTLFLIKHDKVQRMLDSCKQFREGTFVYE